MKHEYELGKCRSKVDLLSKENDILLNINKFQNGQAVAWYYGEIVFYSLMDGNWNDSLKGLNELVRLRLFDENKELHVWRSNGTLKGRLRNDSVEGEGNITEFVEAKPYLNGTSFSQSKSGSGIFATEKKGISYDLPFPELESLIGSEDRITLLTRNYIGYSDIDQAGYEDCRFVNFGIEITPKNK